MKIITQLSAFDYSEIEILEDLERCKLVIDNVPDENLIVKELKKYENTKIPPGICNLLAYLEHNKDKIDYSNYERNDWKWRYGKF